MSQTLQFEVDPLRVSEDIVGSVLVAVDVLAYAREEYPRPTEPVCLIAAAHTGNLSSVSKAYVKLFVAGSPAEEKLVLRDFTAYLGMFDGGTLAAHYGAVETAEEGFDLPYLLLRARDVQPELYPALKHALKKFRKHDTCLYVKHNMNLPSADLDYVEGYYGLLRRPEAAVDDPRASLAAYWRDGDRSVLKFGLANVYNTLRIAQAQIKKSVCCTDIPL
jgi:hypothetical protein